MTEEELLALLSTSPAGIRGAQNAVLAAQRTPLAQIEATGPAPYRVPLMRTGGDRQFIYPGFGIDPERQAAGGNNPVPPGGTVPDPAGSTPAPGSGSGSGIDLNALLAGLGGGTGGAGLGSLPAFNSSVPATSGDGSNSGGLLSGAGLTLTALSALLKVAPWLAKQLGLTDAQAAALTATTPVSQHIGPDGPGAQAIDPDPYWSPDTLTPTTPVSDLIGPDGPGAQAIDPGDAPYQVNAADFSPVADAGMGGGLAWDPAAGAGEWAGTGTDIGDAFSGPLIDPASLGIPDLSFDVGGLTIDPMSLGAGALGSWLGGKMASASVRGDEQQGWASKLGGMAGGALGSLVLPGIGTLVGSLLGSNLAGQLGAGEPDDPFAAFDGQVFYGDQAPGFSLGGVYTSNGGQGTQAEGLRTWLLDALNQRATAEGYIANPEMVNQPGFSAGFHYRPGYNDPLFYRWREPGSGAKPDEAGWRGANDEAGWRGLLDTAWGDLVGRNYFVRPGTTDSWQKVQEQITSPHNPQAQNQRSGGEAGDFEIPGSATPVEQRTYTPVWDTGQKRETVGGVHGYVTWETSGGGEAGEQQTPVFHAGPPPQPEAPPQPEPESQPPPPDMDYSQIGAARQGGLIPPTPGGTQPVPLEAHTGEFVIRPEAVAQFGPEMLTAINRGTFPAMPPPGDTDMVEGAEDIGDYGEEEDEHSGPWTRAYGDVSYGPSPFERVTAEGEDADPMAAMRDLPPQVQMAMLATLGADPMVASAWLKVLGPKYQQVIAEALKAAGAMKQQQAMVMQGGMAGGLPMPGAAPAPGPVM